MITLRGGRCPRHLHGMFTTPGRAGGASHQRSLSVAGGIVCQQIQPSCRGKNWEAFCHHPCPLVGDPFCCQALESQEAQCCCLWLCRRGRTPCHYKCWMGLVRAQPRGAACHSVPRAQGRLNPARLSALRLVLPHHSVCVSPSPLSFLSVCLSASPLGAGHPGGRLVLRHALCDTVC